MLVGHREGVGLTRRIINVLIAFLIPNKRRKYKVNHLHRLSEFNSSPNQTRELPPNVIPSISKVIHNLLPASYVPILTILGMDDHLLETMAFRK